MQGNLNVEPCASYSYILLMAFAGSKTNDIQGIISSKKKIFWSLSDI